MIVTLTHHQARSVAYRVSPLHQQAMLDHRTKHGKTQHDYDLPAIAWRQILDRMTEVCFGPQGGKLDRGVPKSAYAAIKRIAEGVRRIENHPALKERGIEGWVGEMVPAWTDGVQHLPYPPSRPQIGRGFAVFVPRHITFNEMRLTVWSPVQTAVDGSWTLRQGTHMRFVGADASAQSELLPDEFQLEDLVGGQPFGASDR